MKRLTRWAAVGVVAAAVAAPIALLAQSEPSSAPSSAATDSGAPNWIRQSTVDSQTQLSELEASLSLSTERVAALKAELEAIKGDRDKQNAALIAAGERVRHGFRRFVRWQRIQPPSLAYPIDVSLRQQCPQPRAETAAAVKVAKQRLPLAVPLLQSEQLCVE